MLIDPVAKRRLPPAAEFQGDDVLSWHGADGELLALAKVEPEASWFSMLGIAVYRCEPSDQRLTCAADPVEGAAWDVVVDTYFRSVVPIALSLLGYPCLHGSGVASQRGVLVMVGGSRAGKTTMALGLRDMGHRLVADDAVVIGPWDDMRTGTPALRPVPFALLASDAVADRVVKPLPEQVQRPSAPTPLGAPMPIVAIVRLNRAGPRATTAVPGGAPRLTRLTGTEAVSALMESAFLHEKSSPRAADRTRGYLRLAKVVPVHTLTFGSGYDRLPEAVGLLNGLLT